MFINSYTDAITHVAVGHTHFHPNNCTDRQIERMVVDAKKQVRHFRHCFSQFLYGAKALRKPQKYAPLLITSIEGANSNVIQAKTIHFHFSLGNIPGTLSTEEIAEVFKHCWTKAGLSSRDIWLRHRHDTGAQGWNNYITKEAERGNVGTLDFENTQIPHAALANGQRT